MALTHKILITGPSGAGKSSFIRQGLKHYGSGLVAMAPGNDEANSYHELLDNPSYAFRGFDDPFFSPDSNDFVATGHQEMVKWLREQYTLLKSDVSSGKAPRYAVIAADTISAMGRLAFNAALGKFRLQGPPAAQSPDGAAFYGYMRMTMESAFRIMRAINGLGVHWLAVAHPKIAQVGEIMKTQAAPSAEKVMPDMPGGFRDVVPSFFDIVLHAGVAPGADANAPMIHYLQWRSDPKWPTKSRLGLLSDQPLIANNFDTVIEKIENAARERR